MTLSPAWRTRWFAAGGAVLAVACGWWVAQGEFAIPALAGAVALAMGLVRVAGLPLDVIALAVLLVGYIIGNRGFAQLSLVPGLPVLPAEAGLALCLVCMILRSAARKTLPIQRDLLNAAVGFWIVVGSARIVSDVRIYGAMALRDFAMTYYALFFFVAQALAQKARVRLLLERCLLWSTVVLLPLAALFLRFPDFFVNTLTVAGTPLIYFKGDLAATFMGVGALLMYRRWETTRRAIWFLLCLVSMLGVLLSENRASLLALVVATVWLAAGGRWGLVRAQLAAVGLAALVLLGGAVIGLGTDSAHDSAAWRLYERVLSVADVSGTRVYESADVEFKGDNNRYRLVWWQSVIDETMAGNPWVGLGFGYDLAAAFVRQYYPDNDEDFPTRSPHSIVVTTFGRTGALGVIALLAVVGTMARRTWRAVRAPRDADTTGAPVPTPDSPPPVSPSPLLPLSPSSYSSAPAAPANWSLWLPPWVILISACFGVVLEGPMGAVLFWTMLGLANATLETPSSSLSDSLPSIVKEHSDSETSKTRAPDLPTPPPMRDGALTR